MATLIVSHGIAKWRFRMLGRKSVIALCVTVAAAAYLASPYVRIWQLMEAVRHGDQGMLRAGVDWDAVRAGLKADIAEGLVGGFGDQDAPAETRLASNVLPQFGASFISGVAETVVDREVTPEHLAEMVRQLGPEEGGGSVSSLPLGRVKHAFFDSPTSFDLEVLCPGQDDTDAPLRVRLALRDGEWRVVRAWIPQDLVDLANSRT